MIFLKRKFKIELSKWNFILLSIIFIVFFLNSCKSVFFDIRNFKHPILLNENPFIGDSLNRPTMSEVDFIDAEGASGSYSSYYIAQDKEGRFKTEELDSYSGTGGSIENNIFYSINNDSTRIITNLNLTLISGAANWGLLVATNMTIKVKGSVLKINNK